MKQLGNLTKIDFKRKIKILKRDCPGVQIRRDSKTML